MEFGCPINYRAYVLEKFNSFPHIEEMENLGLEIEGIKKCEGVNIRTMYKLMRNGNGDFKWNYRFYNEIEVPDRLLTPLREHGRYFIQH